VGAELEDRASRMAYAPLAGGRPEVCRAGARGNAAADRLCTEDRRDRRRAACTTRGRSVESTGSLLSSRCHPTCVDSRLAGMCSDDDHPANEEWSARIGQAARQRSHGRVGRRGSTDVGSSGGPCRLDAGMSVQNSSGSGMLETACMDRGLPAVSERTRSACIAVHSRASRGVPAGTALIGDRQADTRGIAAAGRRRSSLPRHRSRRKGNAPPHRIDAARVGGRTGFSHRVLGRV